MIGVLQARQFMGSSVLCFGLSLLWKYHMWVKMLSPA